MGNLWDHMDFILNFFFKYNLNCTQREKNKLCKDIPLSLIQLIQNNLMQSNVNSGLPNLVIDKCNLNVKNVTTHL